MQCSLLATFTNLVGLSHSVKTPSQVGTPDDDDDVLLLLLMELSGSFKSSPF